MLLPVLLTLLSLRSDLLQCPEGEALHPGGLTTMEKGTPLTLCLDSVLLFMELKICLTLNHTLSLVSMKSPTPVHCYCCQEATSSTLSFLTYFFQTHFPSWMVATGIFCRLFHLHAEHWSLLLCQSSIPCLLFFVGGREKKEQELLFYLQHTSEYHYL